jgi:hypothetical protein
MLPIQTILAETVVRHDAHPVTGRKALHFGSQRFHDANAFVANE